MLLVSLAQGVDQFWAGGHDRVLARRSFDYRAIDVQQGALDQTGLHTLLDHADEQLLENLFPPPRAGLGKHAVVGDFSFQVKPQKPEEIQSDTHLFDQFPLAANVIEEQQEHHLEDDPGIEGNIAGPAVEMPHGGQDKDKV